LLDHVNTPLAYNNVQKDRVETVIATERTDASATIGDRKPESGRATATAGWRTFVTDLLTAAVPTVVTVYTHRRRRCNNNNITEQISPSTNRQNQSQCYGASPAVWDHTVLLVTRYR